MASSPDSVLLPSCPLCLGTLWAHAHMGFVKSPFFSPLGLCLLPGKWGTWMTQSSRARLGPSFCGLGSVPQRHWVPSQGQAPGCAEKANVGPCLLDECSQQQLSAADHLLAHGADRWAHSGSQGNLRFCLVFPLVCWTNSCLSSNIYLKSYLFWGDFLAPFQTWILMAFLAFLSRSTSSCNRRGRM